MKISQNDNLKSLNAPIFSGLTSMRCYIENKFIAFVNMYIKTLNNVILKLILIYLEKQYLDIQTPKQ